jgi:flagellar hook-associated protein 3 FlgL
MLNKNLTFSMRRNFERLNELSNQLGTGQRVNTVSDDVVATRSIMSLKRTNARLGVYTENLRAARSSLTVATNALEQASEVMVNIKQVGVQAATETYSASDLEAMSVTLDGMLQSLVTVVNTHGEHGYVFAGESMDSKPYEVATGPDGEISEVHYAGEMLSTSVQVGPATSSEVNMVGEKLINRTGDLFETVIDLREAVAAGDHDRIEQLLGELDNRHTDIVHGIGRLGERMSQLDVMEQSNETFQAFNEEIISRRQDADVGEVTVEYNTQMALLQMVMKVASQSTMPSIANYI